MFIDLLSESSRKKGRVSPSGNQDEPIFRGYVLPDHSEFSVIFYKLFQLRQTHRIGNASSYQAIFGKCMPGNYCNDYQTSHVHTLHIHSGYIHEHT